MKRIELLLITFVFTLFLSACSDSNGDNEPDNPNSPDSTYESLGIKPSELPGTWLIEKFVDDDNNATTIINQEITIDNFPIRKTDGTYVNDGLYEFWAGNYEEIVTYGENKCNLIISFIKRSKASDSTVEIPGFGTDFMFFDDGQYLSFSINCEKYENNQLSGIGAFSYGKVGTDITVKSGTITMKKIR